MQLDLLPPTLVGEDKRFLEEQIVTYIGNKRSLLPFIGQGIEFVKTRLGRKRLRVLDLFSGSGIVARYLKQHAEHIIANDLEAYSRVLNECYLSNRNQFELRELERLVSDLRTRILAELAPGFITDLYAPADENAITKDDRCFYTRRNAMFLDTAVQLIRKMPPAQQRYVLGPLLSRASVHANTSGVFKGFYKNAEGVGQFGGHGKDALTRILGQIDVEVPVLSRFECSYEVHQRDSNALVGDIPEVDLAYLDPPYNQHPYGSNYFMLNLLVNYQKPSEISVVSGIPVDWNRSRFNQRKQAADALFDLINRIRARYILISYNSEGFIQQDQFLARLSAIGRITVLETTYNTFRGSRNLNNRPIHVTEFLYLVEK